MTEKADLNSENTLRSGKNGTSVKKNPFEKVFVTFETDFRFFLLGVGEFAGFRGEFGN